MNRTPKTDPARPGAQSEPPPERPHDPIEPDPADPKPAPPAAEPQPDAPAHETELPPDANPANWVDHED